MTSELMAREDAKARQVLPEPIAQFIAECRQRPHPDSYLIAVLHKVQNQFGFLGREHLDAVSQLMQIPSAKVTGVASFYHFFTFTPQGEHKLAVCLGTACFVKGADRVLARFKELLGIEVGMTTLDRRFSLQVARCVGACALAPVVIVDEKVYGNVKPDDVGRILAEYGFDSKKRLA